MMMGQAQLKKLLLGSRKDEDITIKDQATKKEHYVLLNIEIP